MRIVVPKMLAKLRTNEWWVLSRLLEACCENLVTRGKGCYDNPVWMENDYYSSLICEKLKTEKRA